jgi:DNA-binding winged helix-turn-helix (wHTH) protein/TolB-like protein/Tfp pilus assembly protein PilF
MAGFTQPLRNPGAYRFGPFELDSQSGDLRKYGIRLKLQEKPCQILFSLLERPGELITREELRARLWGSNTFVEFEHNLDIAVNKLRATLGDSAEEPRYVETVRGKGYRLLVTVSVENGRDRAEASAPLGEVLPTEPRGPSLIPAVSPVPVRRFTLGSALSAAGVVVLLSLAILHWTSQVPATPTRSPGEPRTVAVLPLRNLKPDPETDFLSLALSDAIINRLGYASQLSVRPASSVIKYRNTEMDPMQVARELNVQAVLTGSYLKDGDTIRVMTELTSTDGKPSPSRENIELKYDKLLALQDRVAESVLHSMGFAMQPQEMEQVRRGLPANPVAYEYYLRGSDLSLKSNYKGAVDLLEKAVALEPGNAMAWADLATNLIGYSRIQGGGRVYEEKGWRAYQKSLALDPGNPVIVSLMAFHMIENGKVDQAVPLLRQALVRNPKDSWAHWNLSEAYRYGGMLADAVLEGELALQVNPSVGVGTLQNAYLYLGQYQEFLRSLPSTESARTSFYRGLTYLCLKDPSRAAAEFDHAVALNPALLHAQIGEALAFAIAGQRTKGIALMRRIEASESHDGEMVYKMSQAYAQLGGKESSLRLLRRSIDLNFFPYSYFAQDPLLEPIRTEPRYVAVMELGRKRQQAFRQRFF